MSDSHRKLCLSYVLEIKYLTDYMVSYLYQMALDGIDFTIIKTRGFIFGGGAILVFLMVVFLCFSLRKINSDFYLLKKGFILVPF